MILNCNRQAKAYTFEPITQLTFTQFGGSESITAVTKFSVHPNNSSSGFTCKRYLAKWRHSSFFDNLWTKEFFYIILLEKWRVEEMENRFYVTHLQAHVAEGQTSKLEFSIYLTKRPLAKSLLLTDKMVKDLTHSTTVHKFSCWWRITFVDIS